MKCLEGN